jgi:hypothetical protein
MHLGHLAVAAAAAAAALLPLLAGCNEFRIVPSCTDGIKNGAEADTDCGGDACPRCALGWACGDQADCAAGDCLGGFCAPPDVGIWTPLNPGSRPQRRYMHAMTHDGTMTLLFGGINEFQAFGDTWRWDGTDWKDISPGNHPSDRGGAVIAHDESQQLTVLFGGRDFGGMLNNETWSWNGTGWIMLAPAMSPMPRQAPAMAYDAERGEVVLFGGLVNGADLGDTWIGRDSTWQMRTAPSPTSRHAAVMVYHGAMKQAVLFGGAIGTAPPMALNDTWTWDGTAWANASSTGGPAQSPPARHEAAIAYNVARRRVILFGGYRENTPLDDTWEWDGRAWHKPSGSGPSARRQAAMAYDPQRRRVVLFGGTTDGFNNMDDTWEYHQIGNPCQGDDDCDTGHCVDRLCCESDKCNGCEACNLPSNPGRCTACGAACTDAGACGP